jgi:hypothetical protein
MSASPVGVPSPQPLSRLRERGLFPFSRMREKVADAVGRMRVLAK